MRFGVVIVTQMIVIWLGLSSSGSRNVNLVGFWAMRRETSASLATLTRRLSKCDGNTRNKALSQ